MVSAPTPMSERGRRTDLLGKVLLIVEDGLGPRHESFDIGWCREMCRFLAAQHISAGEAFKDEEPTTSRRPPRNTRTYPGSAILHEAYQLHLLRTGIHDGTL